MTFLSTIISYFPRTLIQNYLELQAEELQASLAKAGIDLSDADLEQFIKAMDKDGDGVIDYEEWRDFLVVSQSPDVFPSRRSLLLSFYYVSPLVVNNDHRFFHAGRAKITRDKKIDIGLTEARIQEVQKKRAMRGDRKT